MDSLPMEGEADVLIKRFKLISAPQAVQVGGWLAPCTHIPPPLFITIKNCKQCRPEESAQRIHMTHVSISDSSNTTCLCLQYNVYIDY